MSRNMEAVDGGDEDTTARLPTFQGTLARFVHASAPVVPGTPSPASTRLRSCPKRPRNETTDDTAQSSPGYKRRKSKKQASNQYAPPSEYAQLPHLPDVLAPNFICLFVGTNPGVRTARDGHAYAHPSNHFWRLLYASGLTAQLLRPEQDVDLPRLYAMGNTNLVSRPSANAAQLSRVEMAAGTPLLEDKVRLFRPEAVCIVGKGIWEAIWRWRWKREMRKDEFRYGWQDQMHNLGRAAKEQREQEGEAAWDGARVFVATTTSGLAAGLKPKDKEDIWKPLGEWAKQRRAERGIPVEADAPTKE